MRTGRSLAASLATGLMVANLAAWGAWAFVRAPYGSGACAALQARRDAADREDARHGSLLDDYTRSEHLLFSRPLRPLASEPLPLQALYVANTLPLVGAWSFLVPTASRHLGPTCSESRTCGVLFLILASGQWALLGGALGRGK